MNYQKTHSIFFISVFFFYLCFQNSAIAQLPASTIGAKEIDEALALIYESRPYDDKYTKNSVVITKYGMGEGKTPVIIGEYTFISVFDKKYETEVVHRFFARLKNGKLYCIHLNSGGFGDYPCLTIPANKQAAKTARNKALSQGSTERDASVDLIEAKPIDPGVLKASRERQPGAELNDSDAACLQSSKEEYLDYLDQEKVSCRLVESKWGDCVAWNERPKTKWRTFFKNICARTIHYKDICGRTIFAEYHIKAGETIISQFGPPCYRGY